MPDLLLCRLLEFIQHGPRRGGRTFVSGDILVDACQVLGDILQRLKVVAGHHGDGLHDRRAAAMDACDHLRSGEGIAQLVFHHPEDAMGLFRRVLRISLGVLGDQVRCLGVIVGLFRRQGCAYAACKVRQYRILIVDLLTGNPAARVCQDLVRAPMTRSGT